MCRVLQQLENGIDVIKCTSLQAAVSEGFFSDAIALIIEKRSELPLK